MSKNRFIVLIVALAVVSVAFIGTSIGLITTHSNLTETQEELEKTSAHAEHCEKAVDHGHNLIGAVTGAFELTITEIDNILANPFYSPYGFESAIDEYGVTIEENTDPYFSAYESCTGVEGNA